ncbi:MAG: hypothetical protein ACTSR7_06805 [Promethearchaeota archaeon]
MARMSGIMGGITGFILALIAEIPIFPPQNIVIPLNIYKFNTTEFYTWGIVLGNGEGFSITSLLFPENLLTLTFWLILVFISFSSILGSLKKSIPKNSLKLYNLNIFLSSILLIIYAIQLIVTNLSNLGAIFLNIGSGYYLLVLILILNSMAKSTLKKED